MIRILKPITGIFIAFLLLGLFLQEPTYSYSFYPIMPAAGWWEVDWYDWDYIGTVTYIPQHKIQPSVQKDYAVLQTNGIEVTKPAKICHTYPGINYGWTPEFRVQTASGWKPLATFYSYSEGYFLACTQIWWKGTYALFGYWERPLDDSIIYEFVVY